MFGKGEDKPDTTGNQFSNNDPGRDQGQNGNYNNAFENDVTERYNTNDVTVYSNNVKQDDVTDIKVTRDIAKDIINDSSDVTNVPAKKAPSLALKRFRRAATTVGVSVSVVGVWNKFAQDTTIHGVRMITEKAPYKLRREIWILLLLTGVSLFFYQMFDRLLYYYSNPVALNIRITHNQTIEFPAITICNQNSFRLTETLEQGKYLALREMYSRPLHEFDHEKHGIGNMSLEDLFTDYAHLPEDMILRCTWGGVPCPPDAFLPTMTEHGICFTFNGNPLNVVHESDAGSDKGLALLLNVERYEYMEGPQEGTGVKVVVHRVTDTPSVNEAGISLQTGYSTLVAVKALKVENLPEPHGKCQPKFELNNFKSYTLGNCYLECATELSQDIVGCVLPHMVHWKTGEDGINLKDYSVCTVEDYVTKFIAREQKMSTSSCNCPMPCESIQYETSVTYAKISTKHVTESLDDMSLQKIHGQFLDSLEKQQMVKESIVKADVSTFEQLQSESAATENVVVKVIEVINSTDTYLSHLKNIAEARINFHNHWGFGKQNYLLYEGQIRGWETEDETTFMFVTKIYKELGSVFRTMVKILETQRDEATVESWKSGTVLDIQFRQYMDRMALELFQKYHEAFVKGKPVNDLEIEVTPGRYFDLNYSIKELLGDPNTENETYVAIIDLLGHYSLSLDLLLNFTHLYFDTLTFNQSQFDPMFNKFVEQSEEYNELRFTYKSNVVYKSFDKLNELQEAFGQRTNSFRHRMESCQAVVGRVLDIISTSQREAMPKIKEILDVAQAYMTFNGTSKKSVAELVTKADKIRLVKDLKTYSRDLRVLGLLLFDNIKQLDSAYLELTYLIRTSAGLEGLYFNIKEVLDNITLTTNSETYPARNYSDGFDALNKMMNGTLDPEHMEDTYGKVNADLFGNYQSFRSRISEELSKLTYNVKLVIELSDKFDYLLSAVNGLQERMGHYLQETRITNNFYGANFIRLNVFFSEMSYENRMQDRTYDEFALICDIGGSLGLFVGASFMTFFEIIDAVSRSLLSRIRKK